MIPRLRPEPLKISRPHATTTNLGKLLAHLNMPASELCRRTGIYPRTMTEILAGRRELDPMQVKKVAEVLDVPPEWLRTRTRPSRASSAR
jgi:hypothetical protein